MAIRPGMHGYIFGGSRLADHLYHIQKASESSEGANTLSMDSSMPTPISGKHGSTTLWAGEASVGLAAASCV